MLVHQIQTSEAAVTQGILITDRSVTNFLLSGTCHSGIQLGSDGVLSTLQSAGGFSQVIGEWLLAGTPSTFYVQRTIISGTLQVDPGVGFLQLNANRIYDNQKASSGVKTTEVFFEIADSAAGTNILDTATMTFVSVQGSFSF